MLKYSNVRYLIPFPLIIIRFLPSLSFFSFSQQQLDINSFLRGSPLRGFLVLDIGECSNTLRPIFAVNLLDRFRIVQCVLIIDCTSLDNLHARRGGDFYPHDRAAGCTVVVRHVLVGYQKKTQRARLPEGSYLSRIAFASEGAVGAGELLELCLCQ